MSVIRHGQKRSDGPLYDLDSPDYLWIFEPVGRFYRRHLYWKPWTPSECRITERYFERASAMAEKHWGVGVEKLNLWIQTEQKRDETKENRTVTLYVYKLTKPFGGLYRTDNPKLSDVDLIQDYYKLLNLDGTTTGATLTFTTEDTEETYCTIRDVLKTLHLKSLNEFNSSYPEGDLHPFYFRPTSECKNRILSNSAQKTERKTIFGKITINKGCGPINGIVFSRTKVSPPITPITKKENVLKDSNIPGEQTFASLKSDKIYLLSTDTNDSGKTIDFTNLDKYEISQENYLKDIDPNTYSTVRGENLLELLRAIIDLLNGHKHNLISPSDAT